MTRIIVGEDDRMTSHLLCTVLRRAGYVVEAAADFPSTIALAERAPVPDAIFLDMHMPGSDGPASLVHFRDSATLHAVPVIAMSGSGDTDETRAHVQRHGARTFLLKPLDPARVIALLASILDGTHAP